MTTEARSGHYSSERLNAAIDGELSSAELAKLDRHVMECAPCREEYSRLSETVDALRSLPVAAKTPEPVWAAIAARIEGTSVGTEEDEVKVISLPTRTQERTSRSFTFTATQLAAAAMIVAVVSATLVWSIIGGSGGDVVQSATRVAGADTGPAARAVALSSAASRYDEVVGELEAILTQGRAVLAPETLATIEASLATVEEAIGDVETALADDPSSDMLLRMLSAHQRTKLKVLQRAAEAVQAQT